MPQGGAGGRGRPTGAREWGIRGCGQGGGDGRWAEPAGGPAYAWAKPSRDEQRPPGDHRQAESHRRRMLAAEGRRHRSVTALSPVPLGCNSTRRPTRLPSRTSALSAAPSQPSELLPLGPLPPPAPAWEPVGAQGGRRGGGTPARPARRAAGVPCAGGRWRPGESRCTRPAPRRFAAPHRLPATHARGDLAPDTQNPTRRQDLLQPRPWSPGGPSGGPGRGKLSGPIRAGGVRGEASPLPWTAPGQGYFSPSCILRTKDRDRQAGRVTD